MKYPIVATVVALLSTSFATAAQAAEPGVPEPLAPRVEAPYREGGAVPYGYHVETRLSKEPIIAGAVLFGTTYALTVAGADEDANLIPVAGPFIALATLHHHRGHGEFGVGFSDWNDPITGTFLILDGIAQTAGIVTVVVGAMSRKKVLVPDSRSALDTTPRVGVGAGGLVVDGRF